jgi:hypothetical protein
MRKAGAFEEHQGQPITFDLSGLFQFLDGDVLVPGLGLAAAVDLQADQPVTGNRRVGLGVVDRLTPVDRKLDPGPCARIS